MSKEKVVANPTLLGSDIAVAFQVCSNDKKLLYRKILVRDPKILNTYLDFVEDFYGLWDRTSHHLEDDVNDEYESFFEDALSWDNDQEDEEDFQKEVFDKSRLALQTFNEYRRVLKEEGILELARSLDIEGVSR